MKTRIQNLFIALAWLALPALVQSQDAYSTNADGSIYTYSTNADGSANIVAYAGPPWVVTIPTNINGLTVTSIGYEAFFYDSLTSITIPGSVTSIGIAAFYECYSLTNVTIPDSVINIGGDAFVDDYSLTAITVDTNNPAYSSLNGVLLNKSQTTLIEYPGGLGGSYTIPDSVASIGVAAFYGCGLLSVIIPNSVTNIEYGAFENCGFLTSVTIPASVTSIGVEAFAYCNRLTSVTIPNSVTSIGDYAFLACSSLTSVYFTGNAPSPTNDSTVFVGAPATVYYLPGTTGWGAMFDGRPTATWFLPNPVILNFEPNFGVQPGGFGFTISWATNASVVVEAATNLANPVWLPVSTSPLTSGTNYFSDPQWTNYPERFYRAASAFTVGGTLTGLPAGDTVTLQDNGSDNLTLSNNGTFTFPTALPNGYTYSVTVSGTSGGTLLGPLRLTDFGGVRNGSGTISGANVTNVVVPCAAITGNPDVDMLNAAVADGTDHGGVPGVMYTEYGGPFPVTANSAYTHRVALVYNGWARLAHVLGSSSCSSTTFPSGTEVIQFGTSLACQPDDLYGY